jgi:arylsulfatase A-like enzyme
MTGKYPVRVGITDWIPGTNDKNAPLKTPAIANQLALEEVTLGEAFKEAGYATFFCGKWHLGGEGFSPTEQGFEKNIAGSHAGHPYSGYFSPYKLQNIEDGPKGEYLTDRLGSEAVKFLEGRKADPRPFLLYFAFYTVHTPIQPKKELAAKYEQKRTQSGLKEAPPIAEKDAESRAQQDNPNYAGMVASMDENIGRVLDKLKEQGLEENTVVVFFSDNGGLCTVRKKGGPTCNLPLRSGKGWLYEGGIREPLLVRWPGAAQAGTTCEVPVISTDFYPTMLDIAGLPPKPQQHVDGVSLVPLLKGGTKLERQAIYWHYPHYHGSGAKPGGALRCGDWKLIEFFEDGHSELYNLKDDLGEKTDLAGKMPEKVAELKKLLADWRAATGAKMPVKR